ncbi:MAG: hypothetical protein ACJA0S_001308 [Rickettsiales bacterium]|jgi:hypothetical protein
MKIILIISLLSLFCACQNSKIDYDYPENPENIRQKRAGKFFDDITVFDEKSETKPQNTQIKTADNKLWMASLEVIGALLPIDAADQNSGLIITEWYQDGGNENQRIKINLLLKGSSIRKENLLLSIFKQSKNSKGEWDDEKSTGESLSAQMIKEKIIQKASK